MPLHPDFKRILDSFIERYGEAKGSERFYKWVNARGLDDTKPYSTMQLKKTESFQWAKPLAKVLKQDTEAKYYQVEAHFAVTSMNNNVYTLDELLQAIHTLPGQHVDLNHNLEWIIPPLEITAAMVEDECAECIIRVPNDAVDAKGRSCQSCFENGTYHSVSVEADSEMNMPALLDGGVVGNKPIGLKYTGLAVLDEDSLPGIPLTTIQPLESMMESIFSESLLLEPEKGAEVTKTMSETQSKKEAAAAFCPLCGAQLEAGVCPNKECVAYGKSVDVAEAVASLNEALAKKDREIVQLREKLVDAQKTSNLLHEAKGKLKEAEARVDDRDKRLREAEDDNRSLREDIGLLTASRDTAVADKNEAQAATLRAQTEANKATQEKTKMQLELAELRETTAGSIRREGESAEKLAVESKRILELEMELKQTKEALMKREADIAEKQKSIEKALVENKRVYKILKENNIYEVDASGSLIIPT